MSLAATLVDSFGRVHTNLRISVTDRCNIRCFYCMPEEGVQFKPRHEILSFEEIERFVRVAAGLGVRELRLTGGEPLVRADLTTLVARLAAVPGIDDLAMTTNGMLLPQHAAALKQAGLQRLNISLDAMCEATFERIARRRGLDQVLAGIAEAQRQGFRKIRLNAVAIRGITEHEIVPLARFARQQGLELRFIEFMPLDAEHRWQDDQVLPGDEIRRDWKPSSGRWLRPRVPIPVNRPSTIVLSTAAWWGSSIRCRSRFAATATGCGLPPRGRSVTVCFRRSSGTRGP